MNQSGELGSGWHLGPLTFGPWAVVVVIFIAGLIWALAWLFSRYTWTRVPIFAIPVATGFWVAFGALSAPHGYAAAYSFGGAWVLSILAALGSMVLLPWRTSRRSGLLGLAGSLTLLATFYAVY